MSAGTRPRITPFSALQAHAAPRGYRAAWCFGPRESPQGQLDRQHKTCCLPGCSTNCELLPASLDEYDARWPKPGVYASAGQQSFGGDMAVQHPTPGVDGL